VSYLQGLPNFVQRYKKFLELQAEREKSLDWGKKNRLEIKKVNYIRNSGNLFCET
jgi:hypothetical protein